MREPEDSVLFGLEEVKEQMFTHAQKRVKSTAAPTKGFLHCTYDSCHNKKSISQRPGFGVASETAAPTLHEQFRSPGPPPVPTAPAFPEPRFGHDFSQVQLFSRSQAGIQAKLATNTPGDLYEEEADRVADQLTTTAVNVAPLGTRRFPGQSAGQSMAVPASVGQTLATPGRPLEPSLRREMEGHFGHDFSQVRVHSGAAAERSAGEVNAHAYTVGYDVVFGAGQFAPGTPQGRRLIAHELTHVVQQKTGTLALQRQPQDRDVLSRDLKEMSEDLEKIGRQVGEVAEDLEILRWLMALEGKKLPKAATPIANIKADVAFFAEGLIETSTILGPYLRGKLARTSVAQNFKIYDFRTQFESRKEELERRVSPSVGQPTPTKLTYGFYHRRTDSIHLPPDAKFGDALHEAIHKYSAVAIQNALGVFINEGFTQHFTDQVLAERSLGSASNIYGPNLKCANIVLSWINNDEAALGRAYFQGDANPLLREVMRRLSLTTAKALIQLREDREGLGLCERIEQKGP